VSIMSIVLLCLCKMSNSQLYSRPILVQLIRRGGLTLLSVFQKVLTSRSYGLTSRPSDEMEQDVVNDARVVQIFEQKKHTLNVLHF
jgi:hypothetical protein